MNQGLVNVEQIKATLRKIDDRVSIANGMYQQETKARKEINEPSTKPSQPYRMSCRGHAIHLGEWLKLHSNDPATKVSH